MSPTEQRIAIAEACGIEIPAWVKARGETEWWVSEIGGEWRELPDYLNDLNAVHAIERGMSARISADYTRRLIHEVLNLDENTDQPYHEWFALLHATAAQRCEAFLKTLNLWQPPSLPSLPAKEGET